MVTLSYQLFFGGIEDIDFYGKSVQITDALIALFLSNIDYINVIWSSF